MTDDLELKGFGPLEIKSEDRGEVAAIVATLNVVDREGDVILPGAVQSGGAKVKLSGYNHDSVLDNAVPVGKGMITEEGDKLVFRGRFFMSTERGREAFHTTKELGADSEWSFGFPKRVKLAQMTEEWRAKGARRLIAGLTAIEASPVIFGAGIGTGTIGIKAAEEPLAAKEADGDDPILSAEAVEVVKVAEPVEFTPEMLADDAKAPPPGPEPVANTKAAEAAELFQSFQATVGNVGYVEAQRVVAETEAKRLAREVEMKAEQEAAAKEFARFQQTLRHLGYAA